VAEAGATDPDETLEITCDNAACRVVHVIHRNELRLVLGVTCPDCGVGVLQRPSSRESGDNEERVGPC
jgi:hypothetical protein